PRDPREPEAHHDAHLPDLDPAAGARRIRAPVPAAALPGRHVHRIDLARAGGELPCGERAYLAPDAHGIAAPRVREDPGIQRAGEAVLDVAQVLEAPAAPVDDLPDVRHLRVIAKAPDRAQALVARGLAANESLSGLVVEQVGFAGQREVGRADGDGL